MNSAESEQRSYAQALLIDREALYSFQNTNDALMASNTLKAAFHTDVSPILAMARVRSGGAARPIEVYRASGYRRHVAKERPQAIGGQSGIV